MKLSTAIVATAAFAAGVGAQNGENGGLLKTAIHQIESLLSSLANPNIPVGSTVTATASAYGGIPNVTPVLPTPTSILSSSTSVVTSVPKSSSTSTASGSNSTANATISSCAQDAKNHPDQRNDAMHRCNWAPGYDINTDVETTWPNTGNTVRYTLTITNGTISPQGDPKIGFLINGQNPGPKLEANWGDFLEITVINKLQYNGTSIHWHGFSQKLSNVQDGVNGITECPLAPGDSKTYRFQATSYGTSWYHSHFSTQYGEGVLGPIVINGPTSYNYDIDLGTVMLSDYYPLTIFQEAWIATRFGPPNATNYLLNGQNVKIDGSGGKRSKWTFQAGKKHKVRLINTSVDQHFKVQLDQHTMTVVAADFVSITPYQTKELSIGVGQRYEVVVEADQKPSNYWFRALLAKDCSSGLNDGTGIANGIISYNTAPSDSLPTSSLTTVHSNACVDEPLAALKPIVSKSVDSGSFAASSSNLPVGISVLRTANDTVFQWTIGGISQVIDWSNPTLSQAVVSNNQYDPAKHVITLPNPNVWTYWILQNQFFVPHPMHLHGHDFAILGQGVGVFNGDLASLNFANPMRRDVVQLVAQGWTVIAFKTDNPGAWLMHCHIGWHVSGGLSLQFLERPSDIPALYGAAIASPAFQNTCTNWKNYVGTSVYKQSDSGLKKREIVGDVEMEMEVLDVFLEHRQNDKAHLKRHIRGRAQHWGAQTL